MIDTIDWGTEGLLSTHQCGSRRVSRFRRLLVPLVMQRHILLGSMFLLMPLRLLLPVGDGIHHLTHHSLHPPAGASFPNSGVWMSWFTSVTSYCRSFWVCATLLLLMLLIQCHQRRVRLLRMLSQKYLEEALLIFHYCLYIHTILSNISEKKR